MRRRQKIAIRAVASATAVQCEEAYKVQKGMQSSPGLLPDVFPLRDVSSLVASLELRAITALSTSWPVR